MKRILVILASIALSTSWLSVVNAEVKGDVAQLESAAAIIESNAESIVVWTGQATLSDRRLGAGGFTPESDSVVTFALDTAENRLRWNFKFGEPGATFTDSSPLISRMVKNGERYTFGPAYRQLSDSWTLYIDAPTSQRVRNLASEFDPLSFLYAVRPESIHGFLRSMSPFFTGPDLSSDNNVLIERTGSTVGLEWRFPEGLNRYEFDLDFKSNLSHYFSADANGEEEWWFQYKFIDECAVPMSWKYQNRRKLAEKIETVFERTVSIDTKALNLPISDEEFSLSAMGLRPGDVVEDTLHDNSYRFPVNVKENGQELDQPAVPRSDGARTLLLLINLAVILAVLAVFVAYKRGRGS